MKGHYLARKWKRGKLLWEMEGDNIVVTGALALIAHLVAGDTSGNLIAAVGFGAGTAQPTAADTDITAPAYYNAVVSHSYPTAGQVQFTWQLAPSDTGAIGLTFSEMAFYANTGGVTLPVVRSSGAAPSLTMFAHMLFNASFAFGSSETLTGTWTFTA